MTVLTPPGRGAIASLAVDGPGARQVVGRFFTPSSLRPLEEFPLNRIVLGRWRSPDNVAGGTPGEQLVVSCQDEEHVEVHCHGGAAAVRAIVESLVERGCQWVPAAEWCRQREADPLVADARLALAQARTTRVAAVLLDQCRGALSRAVGSALQLLAEGQAQAAACQVRELLDASLFGERLLRPWKIVLAGRVNAGKSSLLNALLGYQRALVHHDAGTTRDVLTDVTAIAGWLVELTDTAGLRAAASEIESEGMRRARQHAAAADLLLIVADASQPWQADDRQWPTHFPRGTILVHNKSDLVTATPTDRPAGIMTSATAGTGIAELIEEIGRRLVPHAPPPGAPIPFLPRHTECLTRALDAARTGDHAAAKSVLSQLGGLRSHD